MDAFTHTHLRSDPRQKLNRPMPLRFGEVAELSRRSRERSSWPLVWIALAIVIIAIKGLGL